MSGKTIKNWFIISRSFLKDGSRRAWWLCKCILCNKESLMIRQSMEKSKGEGCQNCRYSKYHKYISGDVWAKIVCGARARGFKVDLGENVEDSKEFIWNLIKKQNFKCALSGIEISLGVTEERKSNRKEVTASLDRIDSFKNYTKDNIQWTHKWVNFMKQDLTEDEFIMFCRLIAEHTKERKMVSSEN